ARQRAHPPRHLVGPALAGEGARLYERAHTLLEEEGIAARPLDEELLEGVEAAIVAQERVEERSRAVGLQRVEPNARIGGLGAPAVAVFRAVAHEERDPGPGRALRQAIAQSLPLVFETLE